MRLSSGLDGVGVLKPARIMDIIICDPVYLSLDQLFRDIFYFLGRHPCINNAAFNPGAFKHNGPCRDDRIASDLRPVHDDGAHADKDIIMQGTTMHDGVVTNRHPVADDRFCFLVSAVNDRAILDIYPVPDTDAVDIPADHRIEPDAAIIAHDDIADNRRIGRNKTIGAHNGIDAFYRKYSCHNRVFYRESWVGPRMVRKECDRFGAGFRPRRSQGQISKIFAFFVSMKPYDLFLKHLAQTSTAPLGLEIVKAEGTTLFDAGGKKYLDLIGGISVSNTGHRHPRVVEAIKKQADAYLHVLVYGEFVLSPQTGYASLLTRRLPPSLNCVYFTNSGAEAVEGAMKLAKRFTGRTEMAAFKSAYHGSTQGALSLIGDEYWRNAFRPLLPGIHHLDFNSDKSLEAITEKTACVITETVQAERGVFQADPRWIKKLRQRCTETGTLLILDEVQTGFGRTGTLWGFEQFEIIPDILLLGKALGGGMPLGAFVADKSIMQELAVNPELGHITTFGGHPLCCAAGLASMEVLLEEKLAEGVKQKEELFLNLLVHPGIKTVRSSGLLISVEFEDFETNKRIISRCIENGLLTDWFLFAPHCMRIAPPLVIGEGEIREACRIILQAIGPG